MFRLCVVGNPVNHSKSPWIHSHFAKECKLDVKYEKIESPIDQFKSTILKFRENQGNGLNITMPFKQEAFLLADKLSERAEIAGAVNTFIFTDKAIIGDNTDGVGLIRDVTQNLKFSIRNKKVLLLGAGGAIRGILHPMLSEKPDCVCILNRTADKSDSLVQNFKKFGNVLSIDSADLKDYKFDLVIDGTGFDNKIFPDQIRFSQNSLAYDLKYSDVATPFMQWAKQKGALQVVDGMGMLVEQAGESFYLWTGKQPNTKLVIDLAKTTFYKNIQNEVEDNNVKIKCRL